MLSPLLPALSFYFSTVSDGPFRHLGPRFTTLGFFPPSFPAFPPPGFFRRAIPGPPPPRARVFFCSLPQFGDALHGICFPPPVLFMWVSLCSCSPGLLSFLMFFAVVIYPFSRFFWGLLGRPHLRQFSFGARLFALDLSAEAVFSSFILAARLGHVWS